jgi:hypothetical protein
MIISRSVLLRVRSVSARLVEKIKKHILCWVTFFLQSCRLWDNVERYGGARQATDDNILRRMRIKCSMTKATNKDSMCNTSCFCTEIVVTRTRFSVPFIRTLPILFFYVVKLYCSVLQHVKICCDWRPLPLLLCILIRTGFPKSNTIATIPGTYYLKVTITILGPLC